MDAVAAVSRICQEFHVQLPLAKFFETPTPHQIALLVETIRDATTQTPESTTGSERDFVEL